MLNEDYLFPEIEIEWAFDPSLGQDAVGFFRQLNEVLAPRKKRCLGYVWIGDPVSENPENVSGIMIEVDDNLMKRTQSSTARIALFGEDLHPVITLDEHYSSALQNDNQSVFPIYHEIGHFECGHLRSNTNTAPLQNRKNGVVESISEEVEADLFASHYVSPEECISFLQDRQEYVFRMQLLGEGIKENVDAMLTEYSARIAAIADHWDIEL